MHTTNYATPSFSDRKAVDSLKRIVTAHIAASKARGKTASDVREFEALRDDPLATKLREEMASDSSLSVTRSFLRREIDQIKADIDIGILDAIAMDVIAATETCDVKAVRSAIATGSISTIPGLFDTPQQKWEAMCQDPREFQTEYGLTPGMSEQPGGILQLAIIHRVESNLDLLDYLERL